MSEKKPHAAAAGFLRVTGLLLVIFGAWFSIPAILFNRSPADLVWGVLWAFGLLLGVVLMILAGVIQRRKFIGEG